MKGTVTATGWAARAACRDNPRSMPSSAVGVNVSDDEIEAINLACDKFHGELNYTISQSLDSG